MCQESSLTRLLRIGHKLEKWQDVTSSKHEIISFFDIALFLL